MARVLVVDDERNARETLAELIRSEGYDVMTASTVSEAEDRFREFEPQIVITDWQLAYGETGSDVSRTLRRAKPSVPVIVVSGLPPNRVRKEAARWTPYVICKPIDVQELLHSIAATLSRS